MSESLNENETKYVPVKYSVNILVFEIPNIFNGVNVTTTSGQGIKQVYFCKW